MIKLYSIFLVLFLAGLSVSCKKEKTDVVIGINAWPGYEYLHLAYVNKYFDNENFNVKMVYFDSLADARRAFEKSNVDIIGTTFVEAIISRHNSQKELTGFIIADASNGADQVIAKNIAKLEDLKNKKVGVEFGSLTVYLLSRALESANLSLKDVVLVNSDPISLKDKFMKGEIDAIVSYPPFTVDILQQEKSAKVLFDTKSTPNEVVDIIAADKTFIQNNPEVIKKVREAFYKAYEYSLQKPDDAYAVMAKRENISPLEFASIVKSDIEMIDEEKERKVFSDLISKDIFNKIENDLKFTKQIQFEESKLKDLFLK